LNGTRYEKLKRHSFSPKASGLTSFEVREGMELAMGDLLWDGALSLAQNPIALLSVTVSLAVMFTLGTIYDD
jgi:hypothetical protein